MERTLSEIDEVLSNAKIDVNDLQPTPQVLYFTEDGAKFHNYKLLQLNPHLQEELKAGETLYINGDRDDNSYICTNSTTFEIVNAETSNSLLLVDNLKLKENLQSQVARECNTVTIQGIFHDYIEVIQKQPNFEKLYALLENSVYKGPEREFEVNQTDLYTFDELWSKVSASKEEFKKALREMKAVTVDNKIRILDFEYNFRVVSYMLNLIDENSWNLDEIDFEETVKLLEGLVPRSIINGVFDCYAEESQIVDGVPLYSYKEREVCQTLAQALLYTTGRFELNEFLQAWQQSVPEGMQTCEEMLYGIAIIDKTTRPNSVLSFPERNLPQNIIERFKVLFNTKEKWTLLEIAPYIQKLTTASQDVNSLLAKYARLSKKDGINYYSSKYAK